MAKAGDVLEMEPLGLRAELVRTPEETGGEFVEFDVIGRARGFLTQPHIHPEQTERIEMVEGDLRLIIDGKEHLVRPGEAMEVPPGTPHRQVPAGDGPGRVRIQASPPGDSWAFLTRLSELCNEGKFTRSGFPKPLAAAELISDYAQAGYATKPSLKTQKRLASLIFAIGRPLRPYVFVDQWEVAAPPEAVFDAIADARTYPEWWSPVYIDVDADGPAELGRSSNQHFKGRLPYHLHTRSTVVELDPPHAVTADVDGDLRGRGTWTLTPTAGGTHVRFDWQVHADRRLLKLLTPLLRPALRWNHNWAIARAMEGLEPFAQRSAATRQAAVSGSS